MIGYAIALPDRQNVISRRLILLLAKLYLIFSERLSNYHHSTYRSTHTQAESGRESRLQIHF